MCYAHTDLLEWMVFKRIRKIQLKGVPKPPLVEVAVSISLEDGRDGDDHGEERGILDQSFPWQGPWGECLDGMLYLCRRDGLFTRAEVDNSFKSWTLDGQAIFQNRQPGGAGGEAELLEGVKFRKKKHTKKHLKKHIDDLIVCHLFVFKKLSCKDGTASPQWGHWETRGVSAIKRIHRPSLCGTFGDVAEMVLSEGGG